ncbi:hypothetical protein [Salinisphaera sp. LB1]|uniref:hypothetical protein n=1 Tax=Salinisphaera sp. LB1 TaxID=2183911 RepID=UPI000D707C80|nr:hypothetical protein [Salinisphaera sp. LB1]AWN14721.1 hypothetical protein SALB1_0514 [Salinisphaera sp. LB1]
MLKKTAIAFGLAIVTGSALAASGMGASGNTGASAGAAQAGSTSSRASLAAEFHKLDTNNNGVLSRSEAQANPTVAKLYDSMDTNASIKSDPRAKKSDVSAGGITLKQFEAGMQAAHGGTAGPAVSGGQTYIVMKNGSKRKLPKTTQKAGDAMNGAQQSMQSTGQSMSNTASPMRNNMQSSGNTMSGNGAHGGTGPGSQ